jgi:hypothetical protein
MSDKIIAFLDTSQRALIHGLFKSGTAEIAPHSAGTGKRPAPIFIDKPQGQPRNQTRD